MDETRASGLRKYLEDERQQIGAAVQEAVRQIAAQHGVRVGYAAEIAREAVGPLVKTCFEEWRASDLQRVSQGASAGLTVSAVPAGVIPVV